MKSGTIRSAGILLLALAALGAACGGEGSRDEEPTSRWLDLLGHVPDTSETRGWVVMNDYERLREEFGIPLPDPEADAQTLAQYAERLKFNEEMAHRGLYEESRPNDITGLANIAPDEWRTGLGFTFANVDQDVEAGGRFPELYMVLRGRFNRDAIDEAVRTDPVFSDLLEETSHGGVDYYSWGEDLSPDPSRASAVRRLGIGHRLALQADYLYWAAWTDGLEGMIDAGLGQRRSLADVEHYQLLAQGLDRLDTYTALFIEDTQVLGGEGEAAQGEPLLLPYVALATGVGVDADGPYLAIVLVHSDEETARQNVQRLDQRIREGTSFAVSYGNPWADLFDDSEIFSEGLVVLAKLHTTERTLWIEFVLKADPLLAAPCPQSFGRLWCHER